MGVCHPPGRMQQPVKHGSPCSASAGRGVSQALTCETAGAAYGEPCAPAAAAEAAAGLRRQSVPATLITHRRTRVQETGRRSGAHGSIVTGTPTLMPPHCAPEPTASTDRTRPMPEGDKHHGAQGNGGAHPCGQPGQRCTLLCMSQAHKRKEVSERSRPGRAGPHQAAGRSRPLAARRFRKQQAAAFLANVSHEIPRPGRRIGSVCRRTAPCLLAVAPTEDHLISLPEEDHAGHQPSTQQNYSGYHPSTQLLFVDSIHQHRAG